MIGADLPLPDDESAIYQTYIVAFVVSKQVFHDRSDIKKGRSGTGCFSVG